MRTSRTSRHLVCVECDSAALGIFLFNGNNFTGSAALADVCALLSVNLFGLLYSEVMTLTLALFLASGVGWATRMPRTSPPTCRSVYRLSVVRAVFWNFFSKRRKFPAFNDHQVLRHQRLQSLPVSAYSCPTDALYTEIRFSTLNFTEDTMRKQNSHNEKSAQRDANAARWLYK